MAATTNNGFYEKIHATVAPWKHRNTAPPFSLESLVVIALLTSSKKRLTKARIMGWLLKNFYYYRRLVSEDVIIGFSSHGEFREDFRAAFERFEIPLRRSHKKDEELWEISEEDGKAVLEEIVPETRAIKPSTTGFFDLPAELRNTIFEMVFSYPRTFFDIRGYKMERKFVTKGFDIPVWSHKDPFMREDHKSDASHSSASTFGRVVLKTWPTSKILAPLLTSKQFYLEAMPNFFRLNHYKFDSGDALYKFLKNLSQERRNHIRHISFRYVPSDSDMGKACRLLSGIQHLGELQIYFEESRWMGQHDRHGRPIKKYIKIEKLPGITSLRAIRGLDEVEFVGPCPQLEALLKDDMLKPQSDTQIVAKGKKRKVESIEDEQTKDTQAKKLKKA